MSPRRKSIVLLPFLFLGPALLLYAVFFVYPFLFTLLNSFRRWSFGSEEKAFVGWSNYAKVWNDEVFWIALGNTAKFMLMTVPASMAAGLALALLLECLLRGKTIYRFMFYLPVVSSVAVVAIVWSLMYDGQYGAINRLLAAFGVQGPNWLAQGDTALWAVAIVDIWKSFGYVMLLYVAGLKSIDKGLYEAAAIDGAGRMRTFARVTLPLLSPMHLFVVVMGVVSSFQNFAFVQIMTLGGPNNATNVLVYQIYQEAFQFFDMGKSAALSVVLFLLVLAMTIVQLAVSRRTVHYQ